VRKLPRDFRGGGSVQETRPDAVAARVAAGQDGAISSAQLAAAGMSRGAVSNRLKRGWLQRVHRGVYLLGPLKGPWAAEWAALLACGPRAVLSHCTALARYGLRERPGWVEVTVPYVSTQHVGVRKHRSEHLDPRDVGVLAGMPITSPARTLLDVASSMPAVELERLHEEMPVQRLTTRAAVAETLTRGKGRAGAAALRDVLERADEPSLTRSEAERRLLELVRRARLPAPTTNARAGRFEVDLLWPEHRLVVEVDGFAFHGTRAAFERDRRRDAELQALGYRVLRITWRQLTREPEAVIALIAAALSAARSA
jgi:very-short-patch-repair endonuclease